MKIRPNSSRFILLPILLLAATAHSQVVWDGSEAGGVWGTAANWVGDAVPSGVQEANFSTAFTNQPSLSATTNVGSLRLNTATSVTISASGAFDLRTNTINVDQGTHTIARNRTRNNGDALTVTTAAGTSLSLNRADMSFGHIVKEGGGSLVLNTNAALNPWGLVVNGGSVDLQFNYDMSVFNATPVATGNNNRLIGGTGGIITNSTGTTRSIVAGARNDASTFNSTYSGQVTGNLSFVMGSTDRLTSSRQTLAGTNTYTGGTTVRAGSLIVNGTTTGGGSYAINGKTSDAVVGQEGAADGILGGTGSISLASAANTFRVENTSATGSKAILYPGADNSDTTDLALTVGGTNGVFLGTNSVLRIDIGAIGNSDLLSITGNLTLSGTSNTLDLLSLAGAWDGSSYTIATWTGALVGTFDTVTGLDSGYELNYNLNSLTLTAVPEPSSIALLLGGLNAIFLICRRRR